VAAVRAGGLAVAAGRWHAAGFAASAAVAGTLPVAAALLTKHIIDALAEPAAADLARLVLLAAGLAATGIALGMVPHLQRYLAGELGRRVTVLAKGELYTAVNRFRGLGRFESPAYLNRIELARQAGETAPITMTRTGLGLIQAVVTASGFLGTLLLLNPVMAVLVVAAAVPALLAQLSLSRRRAELIALTTPMHRRHFFFASLLTELQAVKEVRLFDIGGFLRTRMLDQQRRSNREEARVERHDVGVQARLVTLTAVVGGAALLWAVVAARRGAITVGDVTVLVAAVAGVQAALAAMVNALAEGHEALLLYRSYLAVVDDEPDLPVPAAAPPAPALQHGIEFEDVWFRYSANQPWVLRGLTMSIPAGQACALVGVNGSGKSTLVKLLCRFYDPQRGTIRWDGIDLRELDVASLRARMGVLFQDFMQYDLTARENVAVGDLVAAQEPGQVEAAARLAGVHDTLSSLPDGYHTELTRIFATGGDDGQTGGVLLSGGQWQRVALARALLRRERDLLVLDEPSSGLDAAAEYEVHQRLREHRRGGTSLLISHRLGALRDVDTIVVLAAGTVIEQGDHRALLAARGEYSRLFRLQARGYDPSDHTEDASDGWAGAADDRGNGYGGVVRSLAAVSDHSGGTEHGAVSS
jgi:ATP-binding cassette subfamily B protein